MNTNKSFYFFNPRPATRFHIQRRLLALGYEELPRKGVASFSDENLTLNDEIAKQIEYKHLLAQLVSRHCPDVMPTTYCINDNNYPEVLAKITYDHYLKNGSYQKDIPTLKWILKPSMLNNGDEIKLFNNVEDLKQYYQNPHRLGGEHVCQQYISNPDLLDGKKYTFRLSAVFTNFAGIFLYRNGYVNLSELQYDPCEGLKEKKMHVTNYVLDNEFADITQRATQHLDDFASVYEQMKVIITKVLNALLKEHPAFLKPGTIRSFEPYGFDFMLDENKRLWLLEINQSPDAPTFEECALDDILWNVYWEDIIHDFVLPIATHKPLPLPLKHFIPLFSPKDCYSIWRDYTQRFWINFKAKSPN